MPPVGHADPPLTLPPPVSFSQCHNCASPSHPQVRDLSPASLAVSSWSFLMDSELTFASPRSAFICALVSTTPHPHPHPASRASQCPRDLQKNLQCSPNRSQAPPPNAPCPPSASAAAPPSSSAPHPRGPRRLHALAQSSMNGSSVSHRASLLEVEPQGEGSGMPGRTEMRLLARGAHRRAVEGGALGESEGSAARG
jgi:hypothetical protein